jgi:hypothetical protein
MSTKRTREKRTEESKAEAPQGFAEMCSQMMSGEMPDCCGPQMREMMSRWMAQRQAKEEK